MQTNTPDLSPKISDVNKAAKPKIMLFDVNETLIDIESLEPLFERLFGDRGRLREWFQQVVLYSNVVTLAGRYTDFFALGRGVLEMLGFIYKVQVAVQDIEQLRTGMLSMRPHPDVPEALKLLQDAGFRLMTLTNSPPNPSGSPLEHAGLAHYFERQFSVDAVQRFKPSPDTYNMVVDVLGVFPSDICMIATHVWDTIGAQSVGLSAGLLTRPGNGPLRIPGIPEPQVIAEDLPTLARQLIQYWL